MIRDKEFYKRQRSGEKSPKAFDAPERNQFRNPSAIKINVLNCFLR